MDIDIERSRKLAQQLLDLHTDLPAQYNIPQSPGWSEFHNGVATALEIYSENSRILTHTAHTLGSRALNTIEMIVSTEDQLSHNFRALG